MALGMGAGTLGSASAAGATGTAARQPTSRAVTPDAVDLGAYAAFETTDPLGRSVRHYRSAAVGPAPLVLVLQGSGCSSWFSRHAEGIGFGWFDAVRRQGGASVQVLAVEKPGVGLFDRPAQPGSALHCSETFRREMTATRWHAALMAALDATLATREQPPRTVMVIGHSEGAFFAARLAAAHPAITHVALLAATPWSQLHELVAMASSGRGFVGRAPGSANDRLRQLLQHHRAIAQTSLSDTSLPWGHPAPYWHGKFTPFELSTLTRRGSGAPRLFIAHGSADENAPVAASDALAAEALSHGLDLTWLRLEGAGHDFERGPLQPGAMRALHRVVGVAVRWLLGQALQADTDDLVWPLAVAAPTPSQPSSAPPPGNPAR